jgi:hypothetical protein
MAMERTLKYRPAARYMAALAVSIAAVLPTAGCSAPGPAAPGPAAPSVAAPASGVSASGHWGTATPVPGLADRGLNAGGRAGVSSVSCASAGNCTIGGSYRDSHNHDQAYVVSERNGRWRTAIEIPGTAGLNAGGEAGAGSVSCPSAGNCTVSGGYTDSHGHGQVFVASERNRRWGTAIEIPGTADLNAGGYPQVSSVSCPSPGNCAAGGWYLDSSGNRHAFIVSERNGRWGTAIEIPGARARSWVNSVSCGSAGNCAADGGYIGSSGRIQPFVASEQNGRWAAIEVPGMASLLSSIPGHGGNAEVSAMSCLNGYCLAGPISCLSTGYCLAGGYYDDYFGQRQAFVVSRR